jgi:acyl-CoA thioesterase FadM
MGRIKLEMPKVYPFETLLSVRVSDLNYGNHLGNDRVLTLIHEARMRYLRHYGYAELDAEGVGFLQGDCAIVYKSEGFWGDQLRIRVAAGDYSRVGLDFFFRIEKAEDGRVLAEGKTGLVCYDFEARKVVSVPTRLKETLGDAMEMKTESV